MMDIFHDAWLPTDAGVLSPAEALTRATRFSWPRADWNAASLMFLHAMVQTAVVEKQACRDRDHWFELMDAAPADIDLWFFDAGPLPFQCPTANGLHPIAAVLPETPGDNALKKSSDILKWHQTVVSEMTVAEAQIAIISDQLWGIPGGRGYYEGCRGRRPMTIMVEPDDRAATLWQRVWLNVLPREQWIDAYGNQGPFDFPWKRPIPSAPCVPANTHALEMLWQTPRRWRIVVADDGLVRSIHSQGEGRQYKGDWNHPLTAYFVAASGEYKGSFVPYKISPHVGFNDWAGLAYGVDGGGKSRPPKVLNSYLEDIHSSARPIRLRCFGYALGDADMVGAWVENVIPYYFGVDHNLLEAAINTAETVRSTLAGRLSGIKKFLAGQSVMLLQRAEEEFYDRVARNHWDGWEASLRKTAHDIYWELGELHGADMMQLANGARIIRFPPVKKSTKKAGATAAA